MMAEKPFNPQGDPMSISKTRLFGTDGIRGRANIHPVTGEMAFRLGRAAAHLFVRAGEEHHIVIGKDTRISGYMLEMALTSGITSMGVNVILVGPFTTPGIAFLTRSLRADAGIMISASHNPYDDNGIKFFSSEGLKLPDELEDRIERLVMDEEIDHIRPTGSLIGKVSRLSGAEGRYIEFVKNTLPRKQKFDGVRIVADMANGGAYKVAPMALRELGAEVITMADQPVGININDNCGALHPENLARRVVETGADLGVALDGDADRAVFVTGTGKILDGDRIMAIVARDLKMDGKLSGDTLVTTVMSNLGLDEAMAREGIHLRKTQVGDRYILEELDRLALSFGGEQSGHIIFRDFHSTGDGLLTTLQLLSILSRNSLSLDDAAHVMEPYPQLLKTIPVSSKIPIDMLPKLSLTKQAVEEEMKQGHGRLLLRYSGTEMAIRIMLEGPDTEALNRMMSDLTQAVSEDFSSVQATP
jgi:phosphoglucosamine mutase